MSPEVAQPWARSRLTLSPQYGPTTVPPQRCLSLLLGPTPAPLAYIYSQVSRSERAHAALGARERQAAP